MGEHMPIDLVLVRHGESEGNLAQAKSLKGDQSAWQMEAFHQRHTSLYRLTNVGREQARAAGEWIRKNIGPFDAYYSSEYTRAMETAVLLGLKGPWITDFFLRERDQGVFSNISKSERNHKFSNEVHKRDQDIFYFAPPGGESVANACLRVGRVLSELRNECSGFKVVCVCHGNIMWGFRLLIEHMNQEKFRALNSNPETKLLNCTIIHYSRRRPGTGEVSATLDWMRIVCPWDLEKSIHPEWVRIHRPLWTNEALMARINAVPQLINNSAEEIEALRLGRVEKGEPEDY